MTSTCTILNYLIYAWYFPITVSLVMQFSLPREFFLHFWVFRSYTMPTSNATFPQNISLISQMGRSLQSLGCYHILLYTALTCAWSKVLLDVLEQTRALYLRLSSNSFSYYLLITFRNYLYSLPSLSIGGLVSGIPDTNNKFEDSQVSYKMV